MARNSTNDRDDTTVRNLDDAAQNHELTDAELDAVSGTRKSGGGSSSTGAPFLKYTFGVVF